MQSNEDDSPSLLMQLHTRPRAEDHIRNFVLPRELSQRASGFGSVPSSLDPEIRSIVSAFGSGLNTREDRLKETEDAILNALDTDPLWINHLFLKRRPNIEEMSWILADAFEWMPAHVIVPFEDIVVVMRITSQFVQEMCAIITVEPVYADGDIGYWLRTSIYEGSENTSLLVGYLRVMASHFEVLDYPDAELIGRLKYSYLSKLPIKSYAIHPERTQTLFLVPKATNVSYSRKVTRLQMLGALIPFGVVAELKSAEIKELTGLDISKKMCAVALPAGSSDAYSAQTVLERPTSKADDRLRWMGMAAYLKGQVIPNAPWLSDTYKRHAIQDAAIKNAQLISDRKSRTLRSYRPDIITAQHVQTTIEQPGWDLYSPLPAPVEDEAATNHIPTSLGNQVTLEPSTSFVPEKFGTTEEYGEADTPPVAIPSIEEGPWSSSFSSLSELLPWVDANLGSSLEIAPRAVREIKKFRHPHPTRIAKALELLAGPRLAMFRGDRLSAQAFHTGLRDLRLRDGFSGAERLAGQTGRDYLISHLNKTYMLDRHLASNSSGFNDPKMIRIYYFYDPGLDKIIVGWLPTHLQTSNS